MPAHIADRKINRIGELMPWVWLLKTSKTRPDRTETFNQQVVEIRIRAAILNGFTAPGTPKTVAVA